MTGNAASCHGLVGAQIEKAAERAPASLPLHAVRLAMDLHPEAMTDAPAGVMSTALGR